MAMTTARRDGRNRWRITVWVALAALMLLPVGATAVTDEMSWSMFDFAFFGVLLLGAGVTFEIATRQTGNPAHLAGVGVAIAAAFLLVVVTGAVGIIGSEDHDANLMYGGVLAVALIGAVIARFQPDGMARVLIVTAIAQALVAVIALVGRLGSSSDPKWPLDILGVTAFFVALWLVSAWLFRNAARQQADTAPAQ